MLDNARTAVVSCAAVSLGTTEAARASFTDTATLDQAMVRVTTVNCRAIKVSKVPINPRTLANASTTDPRTWGTFEDCCRGLECALEGWNEEDPDGLSRGWTGLCLGCDRPLRGGGLGPLPRERDRHTRAMGSTDSASHQQLYRSFPIRDWAAYLCTGTLSGKGRHCGPIELYDRERFLTVTGTHLPKTPTTITERQDVIEGLYVAMPIMAKLFADSRRQVKFQRLFTGDTNGYGSQSEADLALCNMLVAGGAHTEAECMAVIRLSGLY